MKIGIKAFQRQYPKVLDHLETEPILLTRRGKVIVIIQKYAAESIIRPTTSS